MKITVRTIYPRNTNWTQSQTTRGFFLGLNRRLPSNKTIKGRSSSPFVTGGSSDTPVNGNMNIIPYVFIRLGWQSVWIQYSWAAAPEIKKRQTWLHFRQKHRARIAIIWIRHLNIFNVLRLIWSTVTAGINVTSACPVLLNLFHCGAGWSFSRDLFCGSKNRVGIVRVDLMRLLISVHAKVASGSSFSEYWPHR